MVFVNNLLRKCGRSIVFLLPILLLVPFTVFSATGSPKIFSYQGRLTNSSGILLGGAGTNYYFRFSLWDNANVGSGNKLWPASNPGVTTLNVVDGVFNAAIGDTANGYPDALTYNFQDNSQTYLQVEVSTDGLSFETLGPRQAVNSSGFAINANTVSGLTPGTGANNILKLGGDGEITIGGTINSTSTATSTFSGAISALNISGTNTGDVSLANVDGLSLVGQSLSLTNGYTIPLVASTTAWENKVSSQWLSDGLNLSYLLGNVAIANNLNATGTITASAFFGDGSGLTGLDKFSTSTTRGVFSASGPIFYDNSNGVFSLATSSLGLSTSDIAEGLNLYYTDTRARGSLSSSATGLSYDSGTGAFSLSSGYEIPLSASTTAWQNFITNTTPSFSGITIGSLSGLLFGTSGSVGTISTSSLGLLTTNVAEGSNLYYTDVRARGALSSSVNGLVYNSGTGALSLGVGYVVPLIASTTAWDNKQDAIATGTTAQYLRGDLSLATLDNAAVGLNNVANVAQVTSVSGIGAITSSGDTTTPTISVTSGYEIPLSASTTAWQNFLTTPSGVISAGANLLWDGNTLNVSTSSLILSTTNVDEGNNLYYTDARARGAISSSVTGLTYNSGAFSLTSGYVIPLSASTTDWSNKQNAITTGTTAQYLRGDLSLATLNSAAVGLSNVANIAQVTSVSGSGAISSSNGTTPTISVASGYEIPLSASTTAWQNFITNTTPSFSGITIGSLSGLLFGTSGSVGTISTSSLGLLTTNVAEGSNLYYTDARSRVAISSSATGLSYDSSTGAFSLTSGYGIPLSASSTAWQNFLTTPSGVIGSGTGLSWSGNTLNTVGLLATTSAASTYISYTGASSNVDLGSKTFVTTGTLGAGAITGTSFTIGSATVSSLANLVSVSNLSYSSPAFVKMTGTNTFTLDTNTYLTGNQNITLGGILSGSGTTTITASAGAGYYMPVTADQNTWNAKADYSFGANNFSGTGTIASGAHTVGTNTAGANISSLSTLGTELAPALTNGNWNLGTDWVYLTGPNRIAKTSATTQSSAVALSGTVVAGTTYKLVVTVDSISGGTLYPSVGAVDGSYGRAIASAGTYTMYFTAANTTKITFYSNTSALLVTISSVSLTAETSGTGDTNVEGKLYVGSGIRGLGRTSDSLTISANGLVGIQNTYPIYSLDVGSAMRARDLFLVNSSAQNVMLFDANDYYGKRFTTASDYIWGWGTTATQASTIDTGLTRLSAGTVGIGNGTAASVSGSLQLTNILASGLITASSSGRTIGFDTASAGQASVYTNSGTILYFKPGGVATSFISSTLALSAADNMPMKFSGSGSNYGQVVYNSSADQLRIQTIGTTKIRAWTGTGYADGIQFLKSDGSTNILSIDTLNGRVGVGTSTPGYALTVAGTMSAPALTVNATGNAVCINATTGEFQNSGAGTCTVSSERFKHNIETLDEGLSFVNKLRPVSFVLNETGESSLGFIAEEVNKLDPRLVFYDVGSTSTPRGVRYENMTAVLAKAIQELSAKVDAIGTSTLSAQDLGAGTSIAEWIGQKITAVAGFFESITVGSPTKPTGITVYDKNGQAGCLSVDDVNSGAMKVVAGTCDKKDVSASGAVGQVVGTTTPDTIIPVTGTSTDVVGTGTSTPDVIVATSTEPISTPPVIEAPSQISPTPIEVPVVEPVVPESTPSPVTTEPTPVAETPAAGAPATTQ